MSNRSFYNEILTEHNMHPDFKHPLPDADLVLEGINPTCGDDIFLRLKVDENDNIVDGAYDGDGCAISQASADIMLGLIVGRPREEALHLADIFIRMIKKDASEEEIEELEEASALPKSSRRRQPCGIFPICRAVSNVRFWDGIPCRRSLSRAAERRRKRMQSR